jgi:uncharacterized protein involved in outer membrane biogenesis
MKKIFLSLGIVVVVLIVAGGIAAGFFLGPIVKKGMETIGPKITQVSVKVDAVNLSLLTGSAEIKNLVVGNPEGYQAPQAIHVGSAAVGVNPFSVLSDKIVIRSIRVEAPEITFEGSPLSGNNLNTIMKNINAAAKSGGPGATNSTAKATAKPAQKIEVDDFLITGAKVDYNGSRLTLPDIRLTNLGKGGDGITSTDLMRRVFDELTRSTIKAVAGAATDVGKSLEKSGKDLGKSLGSNVSNFGKNLGGGLKKTTTN